MSYLDMLRTLDEEGDSSETPKSPSVESVETPSKPSTDTLDTSPSGDFQKAALPDGGYSCPPPLIDADHEDIPHRLWLVSTGAETRSVSFCPPVALSEVMKLYPGAQVAPAPEPDPNPPLLPPETEATINAWLDHIGERHAEDRAELLANCRRDPDGLSGILRLAAEAGRLELSKWTDANGTERESWNLTADSLVSARTVRPGGGKRGKPAAAPFNDVLPTF
jgi:hypothetical protein